MIGVLNMFFGLVFLAIDVLFFLSAPNPALSKHTYAELFLMASFAILMFVVGTRIAFFDPTRDAKFYNLLQWKYIGYVMLLLMFGATLLMLFPHAMYLSQLFQLWVQAVPPGPGKPPKKNQDQQDEE